MKKSLQTTKAVFNSMQPLTKNINKGFLFFTFSLFIGIVANGATYYSEGNLTPHTLANWNSNRDGTSGSTPANFSTNGDIFIIQGTGGGAGAPHTMTTSSTWTTLATGVTVVVESGAILQQNSNITFPSGSTFRLLSGSRFIQNSSNASNIVGGTEDWQSGSTVEFLSTGVFANTNITGGYPNVEFTNNASTVNASSNITQINGNLIVNSGTGNRFFRFAGNTGNVTVTVGGNITIQGTGTGGLDLSSASSSTGQVTLNVGGNISISAGVLTNGTNALATSSINFNGGSSASSFTQTGGTVTTTNINFSVANSPSGKTVTLNNALTVASSRTMTVASGATLATAATLTSTGTTTINGSFQLNTGGFASGTNFVYSNGTLIYNAATAYGTAGTHVYWPSSSGPTNVTILQGGLDLGNGSIASRTVAGTFKTAAGVTLSNSSVLTLNDSCILNSGGFFNNAPTYGASSKLVYNTTGTFGNGTEWNSTSATVGLGVPNSVIVQNNTTLTTSANRALTGTLTVSSGSTVALAAGYTSGGSAIAGTLRIDNGGFCTPSAVYSGSSSALVYNSAHAQGSPYGIGNEWPSSNMPATITIQNSTFVGLTSRTYDGNVNIVSGGLRSNSGTQALTMSGTGKTFTNSGTMYGEFAGAIMQLNFTGSTTLAGTTGFIDARNTSVTGTLTCNGIGIQSNSSTGTFNLGAGATLAVSDVDGLYDGASNNTILRYNGGTLTAGNVTLNGTSTIEYNNASGGQSVSALTYGNLKFSNTSGTQTAAGAVVCNGTLTVPSNTTLDMATNALSGTLTPSGTGTIKTQNTGATPLTTGKTWTQAIEYNADAAQTVVSGTYAALTCSNTSINTKTMSGDVNVSGAFTLSTSKFAINGNTLALNGTMSGHSSTNCFVGSSTSKLTIGATTNLGNVFFDQATSADVTATTGTNALQNLVVSGSGGSITLANKINLFDRLSVSAGTFNTGGFLVLRSTSSNTSYVDKVSGTISGQVTVERYMHKQLRGWRAITAPVTYNGISQGFVSANWQSNFGYGGNYGTRISGPSASNGIDDATTGSSLQTYNSTTGAWTKVTNTNTEKQSNAFGGDSASNKGFYMFVRGDRTVTPANSTPNAFVTTTLASKGLLQTGSRTIHFTGAANKSWLIGNPFACPVDMSSDSVIYNNIGDFVYVWDLNLTGSSPNTTGNYATFDRTNWAGGPSSGTSTKFFQSGEGFFVVPNNATASIVFKEGAKSNSSNNNTAVTGSGNALADIFNVKLISVKSDGTRVETDGVRAKYGSNYSNDVDANDAIKWSTASIENIALTRNTKSLSIEARQYIVGVDSLYLSLANLTVGANYEFKVNPINFDASVSSCKLIDNFLNTETPISLTSTTVVAFNITSVAGSNLANRFTFVFNGAGSLPINAINVKAYKQNASVVVDWVATDENNMKTYTVEKSVDGTTFNKLSNVDAKNGNSNNKYNSIDNTPVVGNNYYRVKAVQSNNKVYYSNILVVNLKDIKATTFSVYPNPVRGNIIGLQLNNMEAGKYEAKLFNVAGREVWSNTMLHNGNNGSATLKLNNALITGVYELVLTNSKGVSYQQTVIAD